MDFVDKNSKKPWNYQGTWHQEEHLSAAKSSQELNNEESHVVHLTDTEIMAGVAFTCKDKTYLTIPEGFEFAFELATHGELQPPLTTS